jgi:Na+-transporting NADH:ubiquinone oxidoreductase subunit C
MVLIVAAILSFVSEELKPLQRRNVEVEKMQGILQSVGMTEGISEAADKNSFVVEMFGKYITESFVVNSRGEIIEDRDAFEITNNLKAELYKPAEERGLPIFVFKNNEGEIKYIIPVYGKGLWGPIWGYVSLNSDYNTVYGALFDHSKETPGLGAEIIEPWFQVKFRNKKIFNEKGEFVSIRVVKGGVSPDNIHGVDAISGGTITSVGLQDMLYDTFKPYVTYFNQQIEKGVQE